MGGRARLTPYTSESKSRTICIRWRTLRFSLSTHSAGGVTESDLALAKRIDDILGTVLP